MAQLHKKFSDNQIKELIGRYLEGKIKRSNIQKVLGIGKTRCHFSPALYHSFTSFVPAPL